ncbi:hypothetical protein RF11_01118 [Thelohanellus kitauei]|uniref:Uncharacterized protein n=1 Tax=Thelohanellus kitauei TaxID=669202 RepID=A0A0C2N7G5_THEKT|nr:hypothetical protein RF11_01118 [Thelohanellus kitauei]
MEGSVTQIGLDWVVTDVYGEETLVQCGNREQNNVRRNIRDYFRADQDVEPGAHVRPTKILVWVDRFTDPKLMDSMIRRSLGNLWLASNIIKQKDRRMRFDVYLNTQVEEALVRLNRYKYKARYFARTELSKKLRPQVKAEKRSVKGKGSRLLTS